MTYNISAAMFLNKPLPFYLLIGLSSGSATFALWNLHLYAK